MSNIIIFNYATSHSHKLVLGNPGSRGMGSHAETHGAQFMLGPSLPLPAPQLSRPQAAGPFFFLEFQVVSVPLAAWL